MRILLTGGGSGGHIFPLLAVAAVLRQKKPKAKIVFIGAAGNYENYFLQQKILVKKIAAAKLRRYFSWRNFIDLPKFVWSCFQAMVKVRQLKPNVVFSKGGATALPVVLAARLWSVPVIIHESDAVPGLANVLSARFAKQVELAFAAAKKYLPQGKVVGNPVRQKLLKLLFARQKPINQPINRQPTVLFLGGSLGSMRLNRLAATIASRLPNHYRLIHQTGLANFAKQKRKEKTNYFVFPFLNEKECGKLLAASNLVISRAGAGAIFEIAAAGKPAILIPLPEAAYNHQRANAYAYAQSGAAVVIEESPSLLKDTLEAVNRVLTDEKKYYQMQKAARHFARPAAAEKIAEDVLKAARIC